MQLDFISKTNLFVLSVPRVEASHEAISVLMREHGLDFSTTGSTLEVAVLFTADAYAAASFKDCATPRALEQMGSILAQIEASWRPTSEKHYRIPADMQLWPFQKANLDYAMDRTNTLIADQPGLGKTPTALLKNGDRIFGPMLRSQQRAR